ncbi:MAG: autotransporter outer membrane beta-barrel domain-containing protein [Oxalobacter formigenes]|nr:autotransporter outer membrane beta-barrel domain-containing protein [Oxalobacter formigenes]
MKAKKETFRLTVLAAAMMVALPCLAVETEGNVVNLGTTVTATPEPSYEGKTVTIDVTGTHGISASGTVDFKAADLAINGDKMGIVASGAGNTANVTADNIAINTDGQGIYAHVGGKVDIKATNLTVNTESFGIMVQNNTELAERPDGTAVVNIDAANTNITAGVGGIAAFSNGQVNISGNLTIDAPVAIGTRGNAEVNINQDGNSKVVLNGDITFITPGSGNLSGDIIDSTVNLNLTGEGSSWTGNVQKDYAISSDGAINRGGVNLVLSDNAQWNATAAEPESSVGGTAEYQGIRTLKMDKGVITTEKAGQVVAVDTLSGSGGTFNVASGINDAGDGIETAKLQVANVADGNTHIDANLASSSDEIVKATGGDKEKIKQIFSDIVEVENVEDDSTLTTTAKFQEGDVTGELSSTTTVDKDGMVTTEVKEAKNSVADGLQKIAAMNYLTFRAQMNDVSKRMGDLRSMPQSDGAWGRVIAGQSEYKSIHNTYQTLQIGADKKIDNFYVGATASYTDGDGSLRNGSTDDKNYGFGLYGGWMGDDGQYVDVIVKRQKFESDFDLYSLSGNKASGSYDTWGTSASVEYGWRLGIGNSAYYVEPQAEFMFGHLNGVSYKTSNGVKVKQDGIDSAVGRAGIAAGWVSPDKTGSAYVKASVLHDWEGDADTRTSKDGISQRYTEEMGGTWGEFALGGTFNITKNLAAYGEVETTVGNPVRTTYQVSGGIRYSF